MFHNLVQKHTECSRRATCCDTLAHEAHCPRVRWQVLGATCATHSLTCRCASKSTRILLPASKNNMGKPWKQPENTTSHVATHQRSGNEEEQHMCLQVHDESTKLGYAQNPSNTGKKVVKPATGGSYRAHVRPRRQKDQGLEQPEVQPESYKPPNSLSDLTLTLSERFALKRRASIE